ncbi:hypothetical protein QQF64_003984, partial [Cirrhinus molitorella]
MHPHYMEQGQLEHLRRRLVERGRGRGGRALIKERLNAGRGYRRNDTWLHTSELNDGYDWGRLNLQSVTEQSSLDDFLATAELAGTEFVAEKLNIKFFLRIPRRPLWDESTSPEVLQQNERDSFLAWRRELASLEEEQKLILTPFEKNLDFWRQLWRVIERSDVVVQIVDARNPLLFRCPDLEKYVKEVSVHKVNMLLLNKADLLTREQRRDWARYFQKEGIRAVFWSALAEAQRLEAEEKGEELMDQDDQSDTEQGATSKNATDLLEEQSTSPNEEKDVSEQDEEEESEEARVCVDETEWQTCSEESGDEAESTATLSFYNSSRLLRKNELLEMFKSVHSGPTCKDEQITVGLVGYPNVGKSSTINTILRNKKVSVSATPGHTKHFQTIPRTVLEGTYGINIIRPREDEDPDRPPTYEELLMAYGYMRGFMTAHGQPDQSRSARYVLKDYVNGKLLYCHPPPHINPKDFQPQHARFARQIEGDEQSANDAGKPSKVKRIENTVDKHFFHQENVRALTKGVQMVMGYKPGSGPVGPGNANTEQQIGKPWKKHGNRNKKEKISMASYMAILDVVSFLSISCSIYLWFKSKMGRKMRMVSRRRRQNFLVVSLLFVMGGSIYLGLPVHSSSIRVSSTMRRPLGMFLNDHTENIGYVLGLLSFAISWTAKFPFVLKANRGEQNSAVQVSSRVLSSLAESLYASAILLYDTQLRSVVKAMPWILSAISCAILDLSIVFLICYRSNHKRPSVRSLDSDTESLLGDSSVSGQLCNNNVECCKKKPFSARGISPKGTDMGLYMDVNIQPVRKVCLKEVTISRDGSSENLPLKRTVRVVRVDEQCSSGTSADSSSLGSELEWDFEETKTQWIPVEEAPEDLQNAEAFPLQEWPAGSISKSTGRPGSHVCFCNRAQLAEKFASDEWACSARAHTHLTQFHGDLISSASLPVHAEAELGSLRSHHDPEVILVPGGSG